MNALEIARLTLDYALLFEVSGLNINVILSIFLLDLLKATAYCRIIPIIRHDTMPDHILMIPLYRGHLPLNNSSQTNLHFRGLWTPLIKVTLDLVRQGIQARSGVAMRCKEFLRGWEVRVLTRVLIRVYQFLDVLQVDLVELAANLAIIGL